MLLFLMLEGCKMPLNTYVGIQRLSLVISAYVWIRIKLVSNTFQHLEKENRKGTLLLWKENYDIGKEGS